MKTAEIGISDPKWCEFVAWHPSAIPFHLPAWASLIAECYGFEASALTVQDAAGEIIAGIPAVRIRAPFGKQRLVSLPFTDHCPLLVRDASATLDAVSSLREHVLGDKLSGHEIRASLPQAPDCHAVEVGVRQYVELPPDSHDLHPKKNHRNIRNRAQRSGIEVVRGRSAQDVATYYRLHTLTRRRLGVPVQPRRFFSLIADRLLSAGNGFVATALLEGEPVASGLYLSHNGVLVAKFGASDPDRRDCGAGYLIDWEVMAAACGEGYRLLDFGRTDRGADGLHLYKSGWGAAEVPLVYTHISRTPPAPDRRRMEGLPRWVISRSPLWVCRAAGEVLYRWAA